MKPLTFFIILIFGLLSFTRAAESDASVAAKIIVKQDDTIFFDGRKVQLGDLDALLAPIKEKHGVVWFYYPNIRDGVSRTANKVLSAAMGKKIPVKVFVKEDFSETAGQDGWLHEEFR